MQTTNKPYNIDVAVLLIFFNRPGCFGEVFEQVRKARPSKLFLYQDGARDGNERDAFGVARCREIALNIDWDCEVHTFFQEKNVGCDPSEFIAQKWAFSHVDKCIILEDDDVPSQSFFQFCKELLDKYENDTRINMICGMNNLETFDTPYSYLFSDSGSIWGWATWKRVADRWEEDYNLCKDEYWLDKLCKSLDNKGLLGSKRKHRWMMHCADGKAYYETILGVGQLANNMVNIVPSKNMINNIGNTPEGGTHSVSGLEMIPRGLRRIFTMKRYEVDFPLTHPPYVIVDTDFQKSLFRLMGIGHPLVKKWRLIEKIILIIRHKGIKEIIKKVKGKKL